ncbi:MAG: hypothetical protein AAF533_21955 [Acidobacteriota bacterium]
MTLLFAGRAGLLAIGEGGVPLALPFRASAAGKRGAVAARELPDLPESLVAIGPSGAGLLAIGLCAERELTARWLSRRGRLAREHRLPMPESLSWDGRVRGLQSVQVVERERIAFEVAAGRWCLGSVGVDPAGPEEVGGLGLVDASALHLSSAGACVRAWREDGEWRAESDAEAGRVVSGETPDGEACFGYPGRGRRDGALGLLGLPVGSRHWRALTGSEDEDVELVAPVDARVVGVVRERGSVGRPALVLLTEEGRRLELLDVLGSKTTLASLETPLTEVVTTTQGPYLAERDASGRVTVRGLTGARGRVLGRW